MNVVDQIPHAAFEILPDLRRQHTRQQGRQIAGRKPGAQCDEPGLPRDAANETGIHLLLDPWLQESARGQQHDEMAAALETLVDLLAQTVAGADLPFRPPGVDAARRQLPSDPLGQIPIFE